MLTNPTPSTSTVKFDITLDSATYLNSKITGLVADLDYDFSKVVSGSVSSITIDGGADSDKTYSPIVRNIAPTEGSTAAITHTQFSSKCSSGLWVSTSAEVTCQSCTFEQSPYCQQQKCTPENACQRMHISELPAAGVTGAQQGQGGAPRLQAGRR